MKVGYKDCPCNNCARTKDPSVCPMYRRCTDYKMWLDAAWTSAGGKKTPGGIKKVEKEGANPSGQRTCQVCGKPIPEGSRRWRYCSDKCAQRAETIYLQNMNRKCYVDE